MTPLEKFLCMYPNDKDDFRFFGRINTPTTLGALRAYAEELKQKERGTCGECSHSIKSRTSRHLINCLYWEDHIDDGDDVTIPKDLKASCFIPRPKKKRVAQWLCRVGRSYETTAYCYATKEEAEQKTGYAIIRPIEESWREVEE